MIEQTKILEPTSQATTLYDLYEIVKELHGTLDRVQVGNYRFLKETDALLTRVIEICDPLVNSVSFSLLNNEYQHYSELLYDKARLNAYQKARNARGTLHKASLRASSTGDASGKQRDQVRQSIVKLEKSLFELYEQTCQKSVMTEPPVYQKSYL